MSDEDKKAFDSLESIANAIRTVKESKPNDRSSKDREYQIILTELENVWSRFYCFVYQDLTILKEEI